MLFLQRLELCFLLRASVVLYSIPIAQVDT